METLSRIAALLVILAMAGSCGDSNPVEDWGGDQTWVSGLPIQCLGNPWEQDWIDSHGGDPSGYPADPTTPGLEPEEIEIIRDFYQALGITIHDVKDKGMDGSVCTACSCPAGYKLFLKVHVSDVAAMEELGYKRDVPDYK